MRFRKERLQVDISKFTEEILDVHCQSQDMAEFHNIRSKMEHAILSPCDYLVSV